MPTETLMMKDSGIDCIAEIPENWDISRIKYDATFYNGDRSEEYPSGNDIIDEGIPFVNSENIHGTFLDVSSCKCITNEKYKRLGGAKLKINDIVFCLRGSVGNCSINKSINEGTVASSLVAIRTNNINPDFLNYYLNSDSTVFQTSLFQNGSCAANLSAEKVSNYYICTPILKEQQAIADFLDEKCEKIDKVVSEIEEQIQVLEDYKKSLITETVTKGIDKNVPMKDSGIDWIGNIPKNWEVKKIKYIIQNNSDGIKVGPFGSSLTDAVVGNEDGEYKIYGQANLIRRDFNYGDNFVTEKSYKQLKNYEVLPNDICVSMMGTIGKCCVVPQNIQKGIMDSHLIKIRLSDEECPKYFEYCYESDMGFEQLLYYSKGSIMNGLNSVIVKNIYMPFPELNTQKEISDYLDKESEKIDKTINNKKEQLETIKEYKKSLIYEYVTGKKRVAY